MAVSRWKLVAGGAALVGIVGGGVVGATSGDDGIERNDPSTAIDLNAFDSPSTDSPFDSPGDAGWVDPSPESADSPNESPFDSPAAAHVAPAPAAVAPAPAPAPASVSADSPAQQSAASWSVASADSKD